MESNKKGFTLTEILITLGIVGIIGAITIPRINSIKERTYEPAVNRTRMILQQSLIKIFDIANSNNRDANAITTLSAIRVTDITGQNPPGAFLVRNGVLDLFNDANCASELEIHPITANERQTYLNSAHLVERNDNVEVRTSLTTRYPRLNNCVIYKVNKSNAYIIIEPFLEANNNFDHAHDIITRIFIDADGPESRNKLDEDVFVFGLGNDGYLYNSNTPECLNFNGGCRL